MRIFSKIYIVSHSRERSEKTCLNCNAQIHGRFCHVCGQENTDPRESIWSIFSHFFNDITHFDGKFFATAGKLLTKPGFLPQEFIKGRRASYLHPIRLYVFTSAVFFIIFYSVVSPAIYDSDSEVEYSVAWGAPQYVNPIDTFIAVSKTYGTVAEYDSAQQKLPVSDRDGWLTRKLRERNIERVSKYYGKKDVLVGGMVNNFIHTFPYLLFVSLPVSALFLQLLFITNKNNIYVGHVMFLLYLYVFTFLILLVFFGLERLQSAYHIKGIGFFEFLLFAYLGVYSLIAMKKYYAEGWGSTVLKFAIYNILAFISILALFVVFIVLSLLKV
jgi:hypothetical protein